MRCDCMSCRARDDAAFWAIVENLEEVDVPTVSVAEAVNAEELAEWRRRERRLRYYDDDEDGA